MPASLLPLCWHVQKNFSWIPILCCYCECLSYIVVTERWTTTGVRAYNKLCISNAPELVYGLMLLLYGLLYLNIDVQWSIVSLFDMNYYLVFSAFWKEASWNQYCIASKRKSTIFRCLCIFYCLNNVFLKPFLIF